METDALPSLEDLAPPAELLIDGTGSREMFIKHANGGFLHNVLIRRCGLRPDYAVLDIGSGNGKKACALSQYLNREGRYVGFDIARSAVEWCQRAYAPFGNFQFDFADVRSDWYNPDALMLAERFVFPYADETFDVAFASSLFTHLEPAAAENYLRQAWRVLKPGGRLYLTCFLIRDNAAQRADINGRRFERASERHHVLDRERPSRGVGHDEMALRDACVRAGFDVCEIAFGTWANRVDALGATQDAILAIKP